MSGVVNTGVIMGRVVSESMVEKVARAIFKTNADPDWDDGYRTRAEADICGDSDLSQEECFILARAAIAAMRTPTNAMRKVCSFETAEIEYPAMIDAALSEKAG